jgi:hypothetical protein
MIALENIGHNFLVNFPEKVPSKRGIHEFIKKVRSIGSLPATNLVDKVV